MIQLNRIPWRRYVRQHNFIAAALMSKMKMAAKDRPKVEFEQGLSIALLDMKTVAELEVWLSHQQIS